MEAKSKSIYGLLKFCLGVLLLSGSIACTSEVHFESQEALLEYLNKNSSGYLQQKTVNGVDYSLMYRPTDVLVAQELGTKLVSQAQIDSLRTRYGKRLYFNLSMSKQGYELLSVIPKNQNEFGAMVNQLAFGMEDKIHLFTQQKDTIPLLDFIYPRMYGMSKATTMMFVFPKTEASLEGEHLNFTIQDLGLETGEVRFKIPIEQIKQSPQISFKTSTK